jgi:uncharacterized protein (TIGR00369 family)
LKASVQGFAVRIPFVESLGIELVSARDGASHLRMAVQSVHENSRDMAHGGVVMTLLDVTMAQAARSAHRTGDRAGPGVMTIEMKTTFVRPAVGELTANGRVLHRTSSLAFCDGEVRDAHGHLCAHGTGTFKYANRREAAASAPATAQAQEKT